MYDCPYCEVEIMVVNTWDMLGDVVVCEHCGATLRFEGDYCDEDSWHFAFVLVSMPDAKGGA